MQGRYKTKVTKKKAMNVAIATAVDIQRFKGNLQNFTAHNMDFTKETDWARFLA
jgi:hypothetical protein